MLPAPHPQTQEKCMSFHGQSDARLSAASLAVLLGLLAPLFHATLVAQAAQQGAPAAANSAAISAVKAALDKYKDPIAAVRDGYLSTVGCVDFPAGGTEHG